MSSEEQTPLQKLDDAVHEYLRETEVLTEGVGVSGWVIGMETTRIVDSQYLPLQGGVWYTFGPQTTAPLAMGLVMFLKGIFNKALARAGADNE